MFLERLLNLGVLFQLFGAACEQGVGVGEISGSRSPVSIKVSIVQKGACAQNAKAEDCAQDDLIDAHVVTRIIEGGLEALRRLARAYPTPNWRSRQTGVSRESGWKRRCGPYRLILMLFLNRD